MQRNRRDFDLFHRAWFIFLTPFRPTNGCKPLTKNGRRFGAPGASVKPVIPSQIVFSASRAYVRAQSRTHESDTPERDDSKPARRGSSSFSHVLAAVSKDTDESSARASGKAPKPSENG